jgi:Uma2 family endonuclease
MRREDFRRASILLARVTVGKQGCLPYEEKGMTTETDTSPETVADLLEQLGYVPPRRIRMRPLPGTATIQDVIAARESPQRRLCELVDGVLVEKAVGTKESLLAGMIFSLLLNFLRAHKLGVPFGADGALEIMPSLVRIPDVSFISWQRLPTRKVPKKPIAGLVPDLAIEVLSEGNTKKEMNRKLRDYFTAGVQVVWVIAPKTRTGQIYRAPDKARKVARDGTFDGGSLLPGFRLSLKELFTEAAEFGVEC